MMENTQAVLLAAVLTVLPVAASLSRNTSTRRRFSLYYLAS